MKLELLPHEKSGLLITFCGLDGCGKTTMINMLKEKLTRLNLLSYITRQPTEFVRKSEIFRTYVDNPNHEGFDFRALSLFTASDRLQHSKNIILPALENGTVVMSDRYFYSCLANHRASGYEEDRWIYEIAKHIPKPDLSFFLDVSVETAIRRTKQRESEKDRWVDINLQYRLRNEYKEIAEGCGGIMINTENDNEIAFENIWEVTKKMIHTKNNFDKKEMINKSNSK